MTKYVKVASGYSHVPLPDGNFHEQGSLIALSDAQYAAIPVSILNQIVVVSSEPDGANVAGAQVIPLNVVLQGTTGPQGPLGPMGPQGLTGPSSGVTSLNGQTGALTAALPDLSNVPSTAFVASVDGSTGPVSLSGTYVAPAAVVKAGDAADLIAKASAVTSGEIFIPRGTYTIPAGGTITPNAGVTLRGEGDLTLLALANGANCNVIEVMPNNPGVTIRDLKIDGNRANQTANCNGIKTDSARTSVLNCHVKSMNGYNIVAFAGGDDLLVQGCISEDARDEGIELQGVSRGAAIGNRVLSAGKNGIYVWANGGTARDNKIIGNTVTGYSGLSASYAGIRVDDGAQDTIIANNVVDGTGSTGTAPGITLSSSTASLVRGGSVTGNVVTNATGHGIFLTAAPESTVQGNVVRAAALCGIYLEATAPGSTITGNLVVGCSRSGIIGYNAVDFTIIGNVCKNNGQDQTQTNYYNGITLWNSAGSVDRGIVAHNRCFDDQTTKTQQYGIRTLNTIGASVMIGPNTVDGNGTSGQAFSYGGATAASCPAWKKIAGQTISAAGSSVPHGLPYVPQTVLVYMTSAGQVFKGGNPDATSVVLKADADGRTCDIYVG